MNTSRFRLAIGILSLLLAILIVVLVAQRAPSNESAQPPTSVPATMLPTTDLSTAAPEGIPDNTFEDIQLAWFYKPPEKESLPILAENYDIFVLTHKDEGQRDTLKSLGVKSPILVYLQFVEIKDPGSCTEGP